VATVYNSVYFSNLCLALSLPPSNLTQCQTVVGSKLKTGYEVYSKYLIAPETQMTDQIWLANQLYVMPALLLMLQTWETALADEGNSLVSLCSIIMYIFVIVSVIGFLLWLYYLRILNTSLNQTIQMLNMIPFKLLPKSRKETKLFIAWIIREANKTNHESE
jgi:drug/metabolite transporter (DMT)-like permease